MSEQMIFSVPLKPDKKNYEEINFREEFEGTSEDMRLISNLVDEIKNSTKIEGIREIQISIGNVSIRFRQNPIEKRFKSIEGFMNVEDKAVQKSTSEDDDKQESTQPKELHIYMDIKGGECVEKLKSVLEEEKRYNIFVQYGDNQ